MLELFNINNYTIEVPKYGYEGKYRIPGRDFVNIEDGTAEFFKPYSVIGAVVRKKVIQTENKLGGSVIKPVETSAEKEPIVVEETSPVVEDVPEKVSEEVLVEDSVNAGGEEPEYTAESLQYKNLFELREIADSMGIEVHTRRKEDLRKIILENCSKGSF